MRKILFLMAGLGLLTAAPNMAYAKVNVFACEPEWAALATEIGGSLVDVTSATKASQDVHHLSAKPSLLAAMRKADLVFCTGASLEIGWLPILMKKAAGPKVQPGTDGWIMAADHVSKLDVLSKVDRSMGDVHPEGNPHIQLDPANIQKIASVLAERLRKLDPSKASTYEAQASTFEKNWSASMARWEQQKQSLKNQKVVVYHNGWAYLLKWTGMQSVSSLEPKPGIPPTAAHLEEVLKNVQGQDVKAIFVAPFENRKAAEWLSEKTGIAVLDLPFTVGGNEKANDLTSLFDETLRLLGEARQ